MPIVLWIVITVLIYACSMVRTKPALNLNMSQQLCGTISSLVRVAKWGQSFYFAPSDKHSEKWYLETQLRYPWFQGGQRWCFTVKPIKHFNTFVVAKVLVINARLDNSWTKFIFHIRRHLIYLLHNTNLNQAAIAFFIALSLGDRTGLTTQQWQVLQNTGTSHLIAIAGLHIGLITYAIYRLALILLPRLFAQSLNINTIKGAAFLSLLAGLIYAVMSGFAPPAQRASVMLAILLGAQLLGRKLPAFDIYVLTIMLLVAVFVPQLTNISYLLSIAAVGSVIYLFAALAIKTKSITTLVVNQFKLSILLLPWMCYCFAAVSLDSVFCNLIAIPFVTIIIAPLTFVALALLWFIPSLGIKLFACLQYLWLLLWKFLYLFGHGSWMLWVRPIPHIGMCIVYFVGLLILFSGIPFAVRSAGLILLLPLTIAQLPQPTTGITKVIDISPPKAKVLLLQYAGHNYLWGTGLVYKNGRDDVMRYLLPRLHKNGVKHLDAIYVVKHSSAVAQAVRQWRRVQRGVEVIYPK